MRMVGRVGIRVSEGVTVLLLGGGSRNRWVVGLLDFFGGPGGILEDTSFCISRRARRSWVSSFRTVLAGDPYLIGGVD